MPFDESIFDDWGDDGDDPSYAQLRQIADKTLMFLNMTCEEKEQDTFLAGLALILLMSEAMRDFSDDNNAAKLMRLAFLETLNLAKKKVTGSMDRKK